MRLPDSYRTALKKPMGLLIPDIHVTRERMSREIPDGSYVISVGDRTTERMIAFGMAPSLQITDGLEKRSRRPHPELARHAGRGDATAAATPTPEASQTTIIDVKNPPAEITQESIDAIRSALGGDPPVRIRVDGEEDLLVIPSCVYAPANATVLYGQPNEGMVVVKVTDEVKAMTRDILDHMG